MVERKSKKVIGTKLDNGHNPSIKMAKKNRSRTKNKAKESLKHVKPRSKSPLKRIYRVENSRHDSDKINILLDLDQTLLSAESLVQDEEDEDDEEEQIYDIEKYKAKARLFNYKNMDAYFVIFERPYLQKFLDYLFKNFNVSVWTAGSQDYCLYIVQHIILKDNPNRKLDQVMFNYHGKKQSKVKKGTKNLSMLWDVYKYPGYNEMNTIILDDYIEVWKTNKNNCILAKPFYFFEEGSEKDDFLNKLIPQLEMLRKSMLKGDRSVVSKINKLNGLI